MSGKYAEHTSVSPEKSKMEIERTLSRYGATAFMTGWGNGKALITFEAQCRRVKFVLPIPERTAREFTHRGYTRLAQSAADARYDQEIRRRWRALALAIKAKLEVVQTGIATFEEEFMAHIVLPNGSTVGEWMGPQIESSYRGGSMPPLLGPGSGGDDD